MFTVNALITLVLVAVCCATLYRAIRLEQQRKALAAVHQELKTLVASMSSLSNKSSKESAARPSDLSDPLGDPKVLATLLTVIVNKYGTLRIGIGDFVKVKADEYVSIYVDMERQDILLAMNSVNVKAHKGDENIETVTFNDPDDTTYH